MKNFLRYFVTLNGLYLYPVHAVFLSDCNASKILPTKRETLSMWYFCHIPFISRHLVFVKLAGKMPRKCSDFTGFDASVFRREKGTWTRVF